MAKLIFLLVLTFTAYVCPYPSQQNLRELPPPSRVPRAAYPYNPDHYHHHHHDNHHDNHHEHVTIQRHYNPHNPESFHDHVIVESHEDHPHHHETLNHDHLHDHETLDHEHRYSDYDQHHAHGHHNEYGHDHAHRRPGYDEVYVYIDVPETYSKNSQASVIEAALIQIEDDADLRRIISDTISSELQDQNTPKYRYPQIVVDNKSPSDPGPNISPEFIRRK